MRSQHRERSDQSLSRRDSLLFGTPGWVLLLLSSEGSDDDENYRERKRG